MAAYECFVQTEFGIVQSRDQNYTGQKGAILKRYISVITNIDKKWFMIFEHPINHLSFGYVCLPQLEYYFFLLFFGYLLLNCLTHCIQSLSN